MPGLLLQHSLSFLIELLKLVCLYMFYFFLMKLRGYLSALLFILLSLFDPLFSKLYLRKSNACSFRLSLSFLDISFLGEKLSALSLALFSKVMILSFLIISMILSSCFLQALFTMYSLMALYFIICTCLDLGGSAIFEASLIFMRSMSSHKGNG